MGLKTQEILALSFSISIYILMFIAIGIIMMFLIDHCEHYECAENIGF